MNNMISEEKSSQSGRSMIEMLAVIAVIIVITVGSLYGYRDTIKQHEADRTYEMILVQIASVLNRGSGRTDTGVADMGGNSGYTYDGKAFAVKMGCPKSAFVVKVADVDTDLCEKLMKKEWDYPVKPLAFFRSKNWGDICDAGSSSITQDGYFMTSAAQCSRDTVGMYAVIVPKGTEAEEIQVCADDSACYSCQECDEHRQLCRSKCESGYKCLKRGNCVDVNSICTEANTYMDDDGHCQPCGTRTSCKYNWNTTDPATGCTITSINCDNSKYCDNGGECQNCPENATCDGEDFTCNPGYHKSGNGCIPNGNECTSYPLTTCPTGGICSNCPSDASKKRLNSCEGGYTKSGNTCIANTCPTK